MTLDRDRSRRSADHPRLEQQNVLQQLLERLQLLLKESVCSDRRTDRETLLNCDNLSFS